jgi:hypothetical protein
MKRISGLKLLDVRERDGLSARKGDCVLYNTRLCLNKSDEVPLNDVQAKELPEAMVRVEGGATFINHTIVLGRRQAIAGIEQALTGMKAGGDRKVRVRPRLAYRDKGVPASSLPMRC